MASASASSISTSSRNFGVSQVILMNKVRKNSETTSIYDCPVCAEDFTDPKILPCAHRVCRKCIMSWIKKGKDQATCPLCRAPILSPTRPGQGDLATLVDGLPTDMALLALADSHKVLLGPHVCTTCQNNVTATSYCFECKIKLCRKCTSDHEKFPILKDHILEEPNKLTAKRLAANYQATCKTHPEDSAKACCPAHQELICVLCSTTSHGNCADKKTTGDVATEKRRELEQRAHRLRMMEIELSRQIKEVKDKFNTLRSQAKDTFDDLQQCLEKRRQEVYKQIQAKEDASMTSLRELERLKTALASNAASVENLVDSAPDGALLSMIQNMTSRLDNLESQSTTTDKIKVADFVLDFSKLTQLKANIATLGGIETQVSTPTRKEMPVTTCTVTSHKPRRAELARVLKVGDRVKPGPDWPPRSNKDGGGQGTVTAIPSRRVAAVGGDPHGCVDVKWDNGSERTYYIGIDDGYHLDLV